MDDNTIHNVLVTDFHKTALVVRETTLQLYYYLTVAENEKRLAEAQQEKENIQRRIQENQEYEREQERKHKEKHMKYQDDLIQQIRYNQRLVSIK